MTQAELRLQSCLSAEEGGDGEEEECATPKGLTVVSDNISAASMISRGPAKFENTHPQKLLH